MPYEDPRDQRAWEMFVALAAARYQEKPFDPNERNASADVYKIFLKADALTKAFEEFREHRSRES